MWLVAESRRLSKKSPDSELFRSEPVNHPGDVLIWDATGSPGLTLTETSGEPEVPRIRAAQLSGVLQSLVFGDR